MSQQPRKTAEVQEGRERRRERGKDCTGVRVLTSNWDATTVNMFRSHGAVLVTRVRTHPNHRLRIKEVQAWQCFAHI